MLRFLQLHCSRFAVVSGSAASLALPDNSLQICCAAGYLSYLSLNKTLALPVTSILHTLQEWAQVTVTCSLSSSVCTFHSCGAVTDIVLCCIVEDRANAMLAQHVSGWLQSVLTFTCATSTQQSVWLSWTAGRLAATRGATGPANEGVSSQVAVWLLYNEAAAILKCRLCKVTGRYQYQMHVAASLILMHRMEPQSHCGCC